MQDPNSKWAQHAKCPEGTHRPGHSGDIRSSWKAGQGEARRLEGQGQWLRLGLQVEAKNSVREDGARPSEGSSDTAVWGQPGAPFIVPREKRV